jgi:catechol 2,3-dioxygenase-like lactoylglutathione lyase family enzyme
MDRMLALAVATSLSLADASAQRVKTTLNHIVIGVRDLEAARRAYSALGFVVSSGGRHPGGTQNLNIILSSGAYLELISPYDTTLPAGRSMAERLEKGEGAYSAGLEIASAENAVHELSAAGIKVTGPTAGTIVMPGETQPPPRWWTVAFADKMASRPLFLIQYVPYHFPARSHPNSALSLSALLIGVSDQEKAAAAYAAIGEVNDREIPLPEFGAIGKQITLERGSIFLLRATDPTGPTGRRLREQGEGILAIRVGVTDLDQARKATQNKSIPADESLLISPEKGAGVWLQLEAARQ